MKYQKMLILFFALALWGCSSVVRFDQTCITCIKSQRLSCTGDECPSTFMLANDCVVTMIETGENIYLTKILPDEKIQPKAGIPIAIAKLNGKFFLTGDYFDKLWIISPKASNEACYDYVELPQPDIESPVFELFNGRLMLGAKNYKSRYIFDEDSNKWHVKDGTKGTE